MSLDKMYILTYTLVMNLISITAARAKLPSLVKKISRGDDRVLITVNNKPGVAMISIDELESLEETAEILATPGALASIKEGLAEIKRGDYVPFEQVEKQLGLDE